MSGALRSTGELTVEQFARYVEDTGSRAVAAGRLNSTGDRDPKVPGPVVAPPPRPPTPWPAQLLLVALWGPLPAFPEHVVDPAICRTARPRRQMQRHGTAQELTGIEHDQGCDLPRAQRAEARTA